MAGNIALGIIIFVVLLGVGAYFLSKGRWE